MIYLIHGQLKEKREAHLVKILSGFEGEHATLHEDTYSDDAYMQYAGGGGLFSPAYVVVCHFLLEDEDRKEFILQQFPEKNFIFVERDAPKEILTAFKEHGATLLSAEAIKEKAKPEFNVFALTDAFGKRDKKSAWLLFAEAMNTGVEAEQLHGILFWIVKSMRFAKEGASSEADLKAAGMAPFAYQKAKRFADNFSKEELTQISSDLVRVYHEARKGEGDLALGVEHLILKV